MSWPTIEKLRRLGLIERTALGDQAVRLTAQCRMPLVERSRSERRDVLEKWQQTLEQKLHPSGSELVPGSLSISAQTVELKVPVDALESVKAMMHAEDVRLDLVLPTQLIETQH